jgi:hypothetical protein
MCSNMIFHYMHVIQSPVNCGLCFSVLSTQLELLLLRVDKHTVWPVYVIVGSAAARDETRSPTQRTNLHVFSLSEETTVYSNTPVSEFYPICTPSISKYYLGPEISDMGLFKFICI